MADLKRRGYKAFPPQSSLAVAKGTIDNENAEVGDEDDGDQTSRDYDYLLSMKVFAFSFGWPTQNQPTIYCKR